MRYLALSAILLISVSSCGLFKKTNKHIEKSESVTKVEHSEVKVGNVESKETDKGTVVTETERIEERKRDGGKRVVSGELKPGRNVLMDSVLRELVVVFDSLTNNVQVEVTIPPVEERIVTKERKNEKKDTAILRDERNFSQKQSDVIKESKPDYTWIIYVFGVIALVIIGILVYRKFKKRLLW